MPAKLSFCNESVQLNLNLLQTLTLTLLPFYTDLFSLGNINTNPQFFQLFKKKKKDM